MIVLIKESRVLSKHARSSSSADFHVVHELDQVCWNVRKLKTVWDCSGDQLVY